MINYAAEHTVAESLTYMATWQAGMFQMEDVFKAMEAQKPKRCQNIRHCTQPLRK